MSQWYPEAKSPTDLEIFHFDLYGFIIVRGALSADEVGACNESMDRLQHLRKNEWSGYVHGHDYGGKEGLNLQQIYEGGECWEKLIDHPSYIERVRTFVGGDGGFDYLHGPLFIDECFANIRAEGEAIGIHSGGHAATARTAFNVKDRKFHCNQVNVLIAHRDVGPGDGATMVVPASHKANFIHPDFETKKMVGGQSASAEGVAYAVEVHLKAGDALIFVDATMHGSASRRNPGQRRISVYRYGVSWGRWRHPYRPSAALLERLTPARRQIVMPDKELLVPPAEKIVSQERARV
ncbi:MAG: phytanoyl-CoA dioxygenase family protein [Spirochaetia bacterium]|nr:phytanoyl-CoA dioxygenase family protein [Spirochaetia bacterium]